MAELSLRQRFPNVAAYVALDVSVTRLSHFRKFSATNFLTKVAQLSRRYELLWKPSVFSKNYCSYFLGNLWQIFGYFYSVIWSRCSTSSSSLMQLWKIWKILFLFEMKTSSWSYFPKLEFIEMNFSNVCYSAIIWCEFLESWFHVW